MIKSEIGIIGAGPSGIACAIQLKRYGIDYLFFERENSGGLIKNAFLIENYLGFPEGITGEEFVQLLKNQIQKHRIKIIKEDVVSVRYRNNKFYIRTKNGNYQTSILVVATGTIPKPLTVPVGKDCKSRIFYEVYPLRKIRNKLVAVIGSGDAGFDYALSLSKKNKVLILNRTERIKCLPVLFQRVMQNKKINYLAGVEIKRIEFEDKKLALYTSRKKKIIVDYLVVAIGRKPNLNFFDRSLKEKIKILEKRRKLYIIGDAKNGIFRQTAIAVGDGIKAAMEIYQEKVKKGTQGDCKKKKG
mgnify:CR=1 FL=1|uniref:NAD(P)/FAD-dependent oxidoreductase n=1 Tax=candidate division WOR-3 bacterium TaxID=2052148 RepID=A0A7V1EIF1_UNCW3